MFAKSALLAALFAASAHLVAATVPPACLIAAVNTRPDPSKLGLICGSDSGKVESAISEACNTAEHEKAAMAAFEDMCKSIGKTVCSGAAGSGPGATGSPISPSAPIDSGNAGGAPFTGAASKTVGSVAAAALAFVGLALTL
ncbi:MAG: hypothetical protein Q9198_004605 [Flavoplaca austrocitrina]